MTPNQIKHRSLSNKSNFSQFCFVIIFLLALPNRLFSQDIYSLNIEKVQGEGLSNDKINCIKQDKDGFIWFGTDEGLFRYDGYGFKKIKNFPGDTTTLLGIRITYLLSEKNSLWVGSVEGLSCIDIDSQTIKNFPSYKSFAVNAILRKNDSVLWVGTNDGLFQFNKKNGQWNRVTALGVNNIIRSMCDDKKDHLYIASSRGFFCYTKSTGTFKNYNPGLPGHPEVITTYPLGALRSSSDHNGNIWFGTWQNGLVRFNPKNGEIKSWCAHTDDVHFHFLPFQRAFDILEDNNGSIWIANGAGGLSIYDPVKNRFINYPVQIKSENGFSDQVISLFCDRSGTFWIGTYNGVFKYDPHSVHLSKTDIIEKKKAALCNRWIHF